MNIFTTGSPRICLSASDGWREKTSFSIEKGEVILLSRRFDFVPAMNAGGDVASVAFSVQRYRKGAASRVKAKDLLAALLDAAKAQGADEPFDIVQQNKPFALAAASYTVLDPVSEFMEYSRKWSIAKGCVQIYASFGADGLYVTLSQAKDLLEEVEAIVRSLEVL